MLQHIRIDAQGGINKPNGVPKPLCGRELQELQDQPLFILRQASLTLHLLDFLGA